MFGSVHRMTPPPLSRRAAAEFVGTALLLATVVGSGIMASSRLGGGPAVALLANSLATGAGLFALIATFAPVSGAHLNPVVTLAAACRDGMDWKSAAAYVFAQCSGAVVGTLLANAMFDLPLVSIASQARAGGGLALSEIVATFALLLVIRGCSRQRPAVVPLAVAAVITAAYWFTASTSFANPAVTVARALTDTFTGIRPADVPVFVLAQAAGAALATGFDYWLYGPALTASVVPTVVTPPGHAAQQERP
jgi:glycerol uptake facilitator-like aquaporin